MTNEAGAGTETVSLSVPEALSCQVIYRMAKECVGRPDTRDDASFVWLGSASAGVRCFRELKGALGLGGALKALAKLATRRRCLYMVLCHGSPAHYGWVTAGRCRFYWIERDAVVVGPYRTLQGFRRRGLAAYGLRHAVALLQGQRISAIYVDAAWDNLGSRRTIAAAGFGSPVALFIRGMKTSAGTDDD